MSPLNNTNPKAMAPKDNMEEFPDIKQLRHDKDKEMNAIRASVQDMKIKFELLKKIQIEIM